MFSGLHDVDWASMYCGSEVPALLEALRSPHAEERGKALQEFYGVVHHQGDVYFSTTASLPFLFELAGDPGTPDRAEIVALLVSIGEHAVESGEYVSNGISDHSGAAAVIRDRAQSFVAFAAEADRRVRRAAIPGLGLFVDDPHRALALLRDRLSKESGLAEQLLVVETTARLALRLPAIVPDATAWLAGLTGGPEIRLAALVHRARCTPEQISDDLVRAAIGLLREIAAATPPEQPWPDSPPAALPADGVPAFVAAAFEDMDRSSRRHTPITDVLRMFHELLGPRVAPRTELLTEQLRSPDPGTRLDAIRMSGELVGPWQGDHSGLVTLVAGQLGAANLEVAAEAATVLESHHPAAEPAREALAALVAAQLTEHGPDVWTTPRPHLRRAHQQAVRALARLGDMRALPSLLVALDSGVDAWRAVQVAGCLPQAADQLVRRLRDHLRHVDLTQDWRAMEANASMSALAKLGGSAALAAVTETLAAAVGHGQWGTVCSGLEALAVLRPDSPAAIIETLAAAVRHEQWRAVSAALKGLGAMGPAAAPALEAIRSLAVVGEDWVRPTAVAALWAVGGDRAEVIPLLLDLLDGAPGTAASADVLAEIGPPAGAALPRLRAQLTHEDAWVRVCCAAALWEIGGEPEAPAVLDALLQAWTENSLTSARVAACLKRMGAAAKPALPRFRAELARPDRDDDLFGNRADVTAELHRVVEGLDYAGDAVRDR
jgi:hypothetical protein